MLTEAAIFLTAAVIAVPLFRRLGLGAVLGYLTAGIIIGPAVVGLIDDVDHIFHIAEFGVVLLLFIIGLELQPSRLWTLRKLVFGVGAAQVILTAAIIGGGLHFFGIPMTSAFVIGAILSLSSTAFALQLLSEKRHLTKHHGRIAFSILLFQDIAVIPLLALVPLLAPGAAGPMDFEGANAVFNTLALLAIVGVVGRYGLRFALRIVAASRVTELFTALALLTVIGTALLMESVGLSMALGAFLAGVLLADSEYRHALQGDIEPFKGLLLGLFFIAVGMSLNLDVIVDQPGLILGAVIALVAIKGIVLFALTRLAGVKAPGASVVGVSLSQGGEFAFVILAVAVGASVIDQTLTDQLIAVVILSMVSTPLLFAALERYMRRQSDTITEIANGPFDDEAPQVIIAGFGRVGQIVGRILRARKIAFTALDNNAEHVYVSRKFGNKIHFGDASNIELLRAAGAENAGIFVLAVDDIEASLRTADVVQAAFPNLVIYARARNRRHASQLMDRGIRMVWRETLHSSLGIAQQVLEDLGMVTFDAERTVEMFRQHDEKLLTRQRELRDDEQKQQQATISAAKEFEELLAREAGERKPKR
jgi:glutathione-regulated potassium-efflux system ancillary protein KefC/glutathione-regulated potassium-efflux system protein KefB